MLNLTNLATLLAILDNGTFTAAAEVIGITPSAVSLQVKQMETYFGKPLFDRSSRQSQPTAFALEVAQGLKQLLGGEGGIRTHGGFAPTPDFESGTFDHSATSPGCGWVTASAGSSP